MGWGMLAGLGNAAKTVGTDIQTLANTQKVDALAKEKEAAALLMQERVYERTRADKASDTAEDRAWDSQKMEFAAGEKEKDRKSQEKRDKSGHTNSEIQIYNLWKEGEVSKGKKPEDVTFSKYWEDKNHRTGADSAILAQAVKMSTDVAGVIDEEAVQRNYSMLKKVANPLHSTSAPSDIDSMFPAREKPKGSGGSGTF